MFSSLEALDAQTSLNAPVARQAAFQPKAKPRARKSVPGSSPAPLPSQKSPNLHGFPAPEVPPLPAAPDHNHQAAPCIDVASAAPSKKTASLAQEAQKTLNTTVAFELCRETTPAEFPFPPDIGHNQFGSMDGRGPTSPEVNLETLGGARDADIEECQETDGKIRRRNKAGIKKALHEAIVVETRVDNSNQTPLQEDTEQRHSDASELVESVRSDRRHHHKSHVLQEATETVSPQTMNKPLTETSKPRKRRLATFAAVSLVESEQGAEMAANGDIASEPVSQVEKGQKKKRFKRATLRKKKVEKRALNLVDPNIDPKKLTMKDIIRLAEAKERKSKEGTARKSKDVSEGTALSVEAGEEQEQNERTTFAPQVHVVDGRIVINQESLTVAAHPVNDIRQYKRVEETHSKLNYHSYMKKTPKKVWRKEDTELFYKALWEFGTNFALMQHLFPGRTRRQIFLKFKKEERACPRRLAEAMTRKPSEYLQFREVINRLNIIPDKEHDALPNEEASLLPETASTGEELEEDTSTLLEEVSPPSDVAETDGLKIDLSMSKDGNWGKNTHASNISADLEPVRNFILAEDSEIPKEESSPPGVKSLSSDQNLSSKRSKSLFSYQLF